jgi:hypothetical protein
MKSSQKKVWTTPQLTIHGDVEKITQQPTSKVPGIYDGINLGVNWPHGSKLIR